MKSKAIAIGCILVVGLGAWVIATFGTPNQGLKNAPPKKPKPLVVAEPVRKGEISSTLELTGSVEATRVARLASPAEGPIHDSQVREGDTATRGQKLLRIGRKTATEALLRSAEQELRTETEELGRIEKLVQSGAIPKDQLDVARARRARTMAQLEKVKESSQDYDIEAPWDGIISKVLVADGNYVAARSVLVEMFDPSSLVIRTAVPEAHSQDIFPEMEVSVRFDAHGGKVFHGKISRIYPELDRRMRTRTAEVMVSDDVQLVPGMFARLTVKMRSANDTVVVPSEAVLVTPNGQRVAYVIEEGKAVQRQVKTGIEAGGKVQILSGLHEGESLVIAGNEKLKTGVEVRLRGEQKQSPEKPNPKSNGSAGGAGT